MRKLALVLMGTLALLMAVAACGSDPTPTPTPQPTATPVPPTPTPTAMAMADEPKATPTPEPTVDPFEAEWEALVAAAKEEGKLDAFICCALGRRFDAHIDAFQEEFGIEIISATGSSRQQADRVLAERAAGVYSLDVWTGGLTTTNTRLVPEGALTDLRPLLIHPDVVDGDNWYFGELFWGDPEEKFIVGYGGNASNAPISYNTDLLPDPTVIQSYVDIVKPEFVGKIVMRDPREAGTANNHPFYFAQGLDETYLVPLFRDMEPVIASDARQAAEWLAQGRFALCIFSCATEVEELKEQGLPVQDQFPHPLKEGATIGTGGNNIFVMDQAPHPNAAKLFLNWMLGPEGQSLYQEANGDNSLRIDIPKDNVVPGNLPKDGIEYLVPSADPGHQSKIDDALDWFRAELPKYGY